MTLHKKLVYINSKNRLSGTNSDFTYAVNLQGFKPDYVTVLQCNIPKSYYMVQNGLNTFTLREGGASAIVTIPIGNYNRTNFKTTLQTLLNGASPTLWVYTVTIPPSSGADNGKYTFTVTGNGGIQPTFDFNFTNNVSELMGFDSGTTNSFVAGSLESTNVIKLVKEDTIYIMSDIVGANNHGILQEVYTNNSTDYDNIVFINVESDQYAKPIATSNNNVYRFHLCSEDLTKIDLNGIAWTMTLCCHTKDNTNERIREYIKYRLLKNN